MTDPNPRASDWGARRRASLHPRARLWHHQGLRPASL